MRLAAQTDEEADENEEEHARLRRRSSASILGAWRRWIRDRADARILRMHRVRVVRSLIFARGLAAAARPRATVRWIVVFHALCNFVRGTAIFRSSAKSGKTTKTAWISVDPVLSQLVVERATADLEETRSTRTVVARLFERPNERLFLGLSSLCVERLIAGRACRGRW
jgi:hypothetical protein